jgi:hypothetical protein
MFRICFSTFRDGASLRPAALFRSEQLVVFTPRGGSPVFLVSAIRPRATLLIKQWLHLTCVIVTFHRRALCSDSAAGRSLGVFAKYQICIFV